MTTRASTATGRTSPSHQTDVAVSVVLPVYNEVENIPILFDELTAVFQSPEMDGYREYEVIFVEDGSDDGTGELIDNYAAEHPHVQSIHLARNWGQSAALAAGFDVSRGEIIVPMDADLQNDPQDIPALIRRIEVGYDCVSGYRKDRNDPVTKTIPSGIQTRLAKLTGPDINDFGCTLTAYRAEALEGISLYGEEHRYIPAQLYDRGYSITEVEVNHRPREHGESRYGFGRLLRGFSDLIFHLLWNRYSTRPFHLFGGGGFVIFMLGMLLGSWFVVAKYALGQPLGPNLPQLLLAVGMVLFGALMVVFGVVIQFLTRMYYDDRPEYRVERVVD